MEAKAEGVPEEAPHRGEIVRAPTPAPVPGLSDKQILALYEPGTYEVLPHDTMRRFIAERLTLAKQTIPHFYLNIECQLDALLAVVDTPEHDVRLELGLSRQPFGVVRDLDREFAGGSDDQGAGDLGFALTRVPV